MQSLELTYEGCIMAKKGHEAIHEELIADRTCKILHIAIIVIVRSYILMAICAKNQFLLPS
jgi:hypothetical protein